MDKKVLRNISYGMYVITTLDENRYVGCIANSVIQVTSDPITITISINKNNYTNECIKKNKRYVINILPENIDPVVIGDFGFKTSRDVNKFNSVDYFIKSGMPVINNTCGYIICEVIDIVDINTHTLFIGKVHEMDGYTENIPMTYSFYHRELKGRSPKNAPTYIEEEKKEEQIESKKWKCKICGYVYKGDKVPEDFNCPICGQPHTEFVEVE